MWQASIDAWQALHTHCHTEVLGNVHMWEIVHIRFATEASCLVVASGVDIMWPDSVEDVQAWPTHTCAGTSTDSSQISCIAGAAIGKDDAPALVDRGIALAQQIAPGNNLREVQLTAYCTAQRRQRHGGWRHSVDEIKEV